MPIDFQEKRIRFNSATGGPRTESERYEFPSRVTKAASFVNGFHAAFTNSEHPLRAMEVNAAQRGREGDVEGVARRPRDNSGKLTPDRKDNDVLWCRRPV